ncbi:MAG: hypothetical protein HWQ44_14800 [Nostoc sp. JL34]|uniref:glycosyltransferase n=1 Tax=Nostoc sp. JL34 TaxID=2815397 RepID=UPI001DE50B5F|nr:hypothetical protein [Nostoc sp. JL34]MBN3884196.1 hypothetical protein [Nostoc sp. JL34]
MNIKDSLRVFVIKEVPHDWLFPQVPAVVHHGGASTTAAVLRAGTPNQFAIRNSQFAIADVIE